MDIRHNVGSCNQPPTPPSASALRRLLERVNAESAMNELGRRAVCSGRGRGIICLIPTDGLFSQPGCLWTNRMNEGMDERF